MKSQEKITVYFDGLCKVCSKEISHYQRQLGADQIKFVDICASGFDAQAENVDPYRVHKVMHVRRENGTLATRVDAFIEIWKALPRYHRLARIAQSRAIKPALELGYSLFALVRPWLPRKSSLEACKDSPYCEVHNV